MAITTFTESKLKQLFKLPGNLTSQIYEWLIENLMPVKDLGTLTDGAIVSCDCLSYVTAMADVTMANASTTLSISNLGKVLDVAVEKDVSGDITLTISGTGLVFIDLGNKAAAAASVDVTLSDDFNEIGLLKTGFTSGGSSVVFVTKK